MSWVPFEDVETYRCPEITLVRRNAHQRWKRPRFRRHATCLQPRGAIVSRTCRKLHRRWGPGRRRRHGQQMRATGNSHTAVISEGTHTCEDEKINQGGNNGDGAGGKAWE